MTNTLIKDLAKKRVSLREMWTKIGEVEIKNKARTGWVDEYTIYRLKSKKVRIEKNILNGPFIASKIEAGRFISELEKGKKRIKKLILPSNVLNEIKNQAFLEGL